MEVEPPCRQMRSCTCRLLDRGHCATSAGAGCNTVLHVLQPLGVRTVMLPMVVPLSGLVSSLLIVVKSTFSLPPAGIEPQCKRCERARQ